MNNGFVQIWGAVLVLSAGGFLQAEEVPLTKVAEESILQKDLKDHASVLASDTLEGREAGTRGGKAASVYLLQQIRQIGLQPGMPRGDYFQEFGNGYRNLIAVLPGSDPVLKEEYILVGGHYDHVGYGNKETSNGPIGHIHNGADDNASGTSALLELAQAFVKLDPAPRRSILFAFWDAEEIGLLGSYHWVKNPSVPLEQVKLSINLDMIGRMRKQQVTVYGTRSAAGLRKLLSEHNGDNGLEFIWDWDNLEDSDHYPFFEAGRPYLMFFTGLHPDYHRPGDDVPKLNFPGTEQITRYVFRLMQDVANAETLPEFRPACQQEGETKRKRLEGSFRITASRLGAEWDLEKAGGGMIHLTNVPPGSAAAKGGLRAGDEIVEFAGYPVKKIEDFRQLILVAANPVSVLIKRAQSTRTLTLELPGKPMKLGLAWRNDDAEPGTIILTDVVPASPGWLAGLKIADRILEINGQTFETGEEFSRLAIASGNPVQLKVERQGRIRTVELKLIELPPPEEAPPAEPTEKISPPPVEPEPEGGDPPDNL